MALNFNFKKQNNFSVLLTQVIYISKTQIVCEAKQSNSTKYNMQVN